MPHDPIFSSFLIVAVVGGLLIFLNLTSEWGITSELARATDDWTAPLVVRSYRDDAKAREKVAREAVLLQARGYRARLQRGGSDDLQLGGAPAGERIVLPGTHTDGKIVITYWRA
jgi:hypothetical protein